LKGKKTRIGVLVSGSGTNLQKIIDGIERGYIPAEIAVVASNRSDAYGLERARRHNIPTAVLDPKSFPGRLEYDLELVRLLKGYDIDLVVMAGYMLVVSAEFIDAFDGLVMNLHPALCPAFPGAHGVRDALAYGVKVTGVTVHFADAGVDTGPIILQEPVPVLDGDTEETLHDRIHQAEYRLFPEAVKLFAEGRLKKEGRKVKILPEEEKG
jgi:phosphoribosylglycinamide formyltransferase-1